MTEEIKEVRKQMQLKVKDTLRYKMKASAAIQGKLLEDVVEEAFIDYLKKVKDIAGVKWR